MKIARLLHKSSNNETYGFVDGSKVSTREEITRLTGVPIPPRVKNFLFDGWYEEIRGKIDSLPYNQNISEFRILAPISNPNKIICMAFNYVDHAKEQHQEPPKDPVLVMKPQTALTGTDSDIECPDFVTQLDYEIELALIIGKNCKNVSVEDAADAVFGYMIFNDVSARDIQFKDGQFTRGKGFDSFAPCGPWITTSDAVPNVHNLRITTRINGEVRQDSATDKMFLKIPEIVSKISRVMTLEKGDIISTGTPSGVALNNPDVSFLRDGDKIEMQIEDLGMLSNTIKFIKSS